MNQNLKYVLGFLGVVFLALGLWYFKTILTYVLISAVLSIIGGPIIRFLNKQTIFKRPFPPTLSAVIALLSFLLLIFAFLNIFAPLVAAEARSLSKIDVQEVSSQLSVQFEGMMSYLERYNLSGDERSNEEFLIEQLKQIVSFGDVQSVFNNLFGIIGNIFIALFSILFITFFFLRDLSMVKRIIMTITPDKHMGRMQSILTNTRKLLTRYFGGLVIQVTIVTILISTVLSLLGVENAFLIGFLAGLVNLIPYIGPIIGALIGIFISVTTNLDLDLYNELLPLVLKIAGTFLVVQLIDNFFTQPYIFSNSVNAHPLEIFIVISMAGTIAGVGGMILAIPVYTLVRIVAAEFLSGFKIVRSLTKHLDAE